jgi:[NiFe] hydrogenase diaphorase moiety small subunit
MSENDLTLEVDGRRITARPGQTIMEAADAAGIYIPRLCDTEGLRHQGGCRVCSVNLNGRHVAACCHPAEEGAVVQNDTETINRYRRDLVTMLFHEGNHLCPICEASGNCELQAMAYRLQITGPTKFPRLEPVRPVDASHPDIALDTNRCISCGRCIRASQDVDGKHVFGYVGRGIHRHVAVNGDCLKATDVELTDQAIAPETCPVGCIIRKRVGFAVPIGRREFDNKTIGDSINGRRKDNG